METESFLPSDLELMRREKAFIGLFEKFNVDEGNDPEITADDYLTANDDRHDSDTASSDASDLSTIESEENVDIEKMHQELHPFIRNRIDAWSKNGTNLQLRTVSPKVTVEEWLKQNEQFSTTTKKTTKTVIDKKNSRVTVTTEKIKTTRSTRSIGIVHNARQPSPDAVTEESASKTLEKKGKKTKKKQAEQMQNNLVDSSKKFDFQKRQKDAKKVSHSPKQVKLLSPRKKNSRRGKTLFVPKSTDEKKDSDPQILNNGDEASPENINTTHGTFDNITATCQTQKQTTRNSTNLKPPVRIRRLITVYSPSNGQYVSLTKKYLLNKISTRYRHCQTLIKEPVCDHDQKIVYQPPESCSTDEDEDEDLLITCHRRTGHFWRVDCK